MVAARSAAMAFNRVVDADIDGRNPARTDAPYTGRDAEPRFHVGLYRRIAPGVPACGRRVEFAVLRLAPVALTIVLFYSFTKRFTSFSHVVLGFALGSLLPPHGSRSALARSRAFCGSPRR